MIHKKHLAGLPVMLLIALFLCACGGNVSAIPFPDKLYFDYFYEGTDENPGDFIRAFEERIQAVADRYPYEIRTYDVSGDGKQEFTRITGERGIKTGNSEFPILIVGGVAYSGKGNIEENSKEIFLTAGEDVFVYQYVYYPAVDDGSSLFSRYSTAEGHATIAYFYRTTCDECNTVKPVIDGLPASITAEGGETPLDIVRFNTRSGNNIERLRAFFEAYDVPDEMQSVPIVFLRDKYLVGYDEISESLPELLEQGEGSNFDFP